MLKILQSGVELIHFSSNTFWLPNTPETLLNLRIIERCEQMSSTKEIMVANGILIFEESVC